jgi:putative membrane protein
MQKVKRLGWLAASASMLMLGTMGFAQSTTATEGQTGSGSASGGQHSKATPQTSDQMGANNNSTRTGGVQTKDHTFMVKAAQGGMAEVQLGQLAQQNGQSQQVKDFGKRMVDDHTKANDQLKQVASQKGVTLPDSPDAKDKAEYDRLSKLKGDAFDKAYSKMMVTDHKKDVAEFQKEANSGMDPDLKSFAGQTLPTLQDHLKMAEQMSGSAKMEGKSSTASSQ